MKHLLIFAALAAGTLMSCSKKDDPTPTFNINQKATLSIQFDNIVGDRNLQLNTATYANASGESFSVTLLQYFISNIKVKTVNGDEYSVPQDSSYFLISEANASSQFVKVRVPEAEYASISFVLGVDSLRSTMGIERRTGALDPAGTMETGMYWGWNSGYIFLRMEGISAAAPVGPDGLRKFRYHIGGFGGYSAPTINNIKTFTVDLRAGGTAKVRQGREANVHLMADILKVFNGSTSVSIANNPTVMFSDFSRLISANYTQMFRHDHTEN